jgi:6-phosphogluconolactonase
MTFYKINDIYPAVDYLEKTISRQLKMNKKVLWLLTGGSGIKIEVAVSQRLKELDLKNLTITLTDERYAYRQSESEDFDSVNHPDSNWKQIMDAGFYAKGANLIPVLRGKNSVATQENFEKTLSSLLLLADNYKVGLFGMGADGHTAGILPESVAANEDIRFVGAYDAVEFMRITMTFNAIKKLDEAVLCAFGDSKKEALNNLANKEIPLNEQPAQILKALPKLIVFNDQIGEEV